MSAIEKDCALLGTGRTLRPSVSLIPRIEFTKDHGSVFYVSTSDHSIVGFTGYKEWELLSELLS